jgi:hypothetical protein
VSSPPLRSRVKCEGNLAAQEQAQEPAFSPSPRRSGCAIAKLDRRVTAHGAQRGHDPEHDAGECGQGERKGHGVPVQPEPIPAEHVAGLCCGQRVSKHTDRQVGDSETEHPRDDREQRALDEKLTNDSPATGAQRSTDGDLLASRDRSREHQPGRVGQCDQEQDYDGALNEEQRGSVGAVRPAGE